MSKVGETRRQTRELIYLTSYCLLTEMVQPPPTSGNTSFVFCEKLGGGWDGKSLIWEDVRPNWGWSAMGGGRGRLRIDVVMFSLCETRLPISFTKITNWVRSGQIETTITPSLTQSYFTR